MGDMRNRVFISYSHEDTRWLGAVTKQLAVLQAEGLLSVCDDTHLEVGEHWYEQLHEMMLTARLGLLLISAPFLGSPFVRREEVPRLFGRHEAGGSSDLRTPSDGRGRCRHSRDRHGRRNSRTSRVRSPRS